MAYSVDPTTGDILIQGFEQGIGASPYSGLTDLHSVNVTSIPGEASVGFSTQSVTQAPQYTGLTVTPSDSATLTITGLNANSFLENGQAIYFSSSTIASATVGIVFWVAAASKASSTSQEISLIRGFGSHPLVSTLGATGTATLATIPFVLGPRGQMNKNYIVESNDGKHWLADSNGLVWSDKVTTSGGINITSTSSWTYTGNIGNMPADLVSGGGNTNLDAYGNGLVFLQTLRSNGNDGWLFLWRQDHIDYLKVIATGTSTVAGDLNWVYGWPDGFTMVQSQASSTLNSTFTPHSHEAIVTPSGRVAFCDGFTMGLFYQLDPSVPFDPTNTATFNFFGGLVAPTNEFPGYRILGQDDIAQCCAFVGDFIYIGGIKNVVYPWDLLSSAFTPPLIVLPEAVIRNIISAKQSMYIFCGTRGRIYISNGSQADLFAKVPDHLSGTVQPSFSWGAATYSLNQLQFGVTLSDSAIISSSNVYGGIWGIDVNSGAIYQQNTLSDNTKTSFCCALFSPANTPNTLGEMVNKGYAVYAGWINNLSTSSGLDKSISTPYTGGQSYIVSDMIPVGTLLNPKTATQIEFKLARPLLAGETVELQQASGYSGAGTTGIITQGFTSLGTISGDGSLISGNLPILLQNQQWLLVQAVLTGIASNPSFNRITQLRIIGATAPRQAMQVFGTQ